MSKKTVRTEMAERIVNKRKELHLTQEDMAQKLGINRNRYARYETNTKPSVVMISDIAQILGVTADELINGKPDDTIKTDKRPPIFVFGNNTTYQADSKTNFDNILTEKELEIISSYRKLSESRRFSFLDYLNYLLEK